MVLGITGLSTSGKSTIAKKFVAAGWHLIDLDQIGHQVLYENAEKIVQTFGPSILDETNTIDRKKLGAIVFRSVSQRHALEAIVHPLMKLRTKQIIEKEKQNHWVIDAALLVYMQLDQLCDVVLYVKTSLFRRMWRLLRRDRNPRRVLQLLRTQRGLFAQFESHLSDAQNVYCIHTQKSKTMMVNRILEQYTGASHGST